MMYDKSQMATGVNSIGLVGLLVYCFKEFKEINNNIEEIRLEVTNLRNNSTENTKRSNIVFNQLSQKLEENTRKVNKASIMISKEMRQASEERTVASEPTQVAMGGAEAEADEQNDEIRSAIDSLMIN